MKDRVSRVQAREVPYIAPRRPLHAENGTFTGRSVRQANPNPACNLTQLLPLGGKTYEECNEYIGTVDCVPAIRAFWVQSPPYSYTNSPSTTYATCAKIACDYDSPNIQKADRISSIFGTYIGTRPNDTRCFVAIPPEEFTHPPIGGDYSGQYRNIPGTVAYAVGSISGNRAAGVIHDVDNARCYAGFKDKAVARQIQQEIGLTAALSATAAAACLSPAQTAAIAASAQAVTVTGLAVGLGLLGSGVVVGAASYAGYKFVQHCRTEPQVIPDYEHLYEELEMGPNRVTGEHDWSNLSECPFERPFAD